MYYKKIYNIALFLTSVLVVIIWDLIGKVDISTIVNDRSVQTAVKFLTVFVSAYLSFGALVSLIVNLLKHCTFVKRIIFGRSYIEGTWVGYYTAAIDGAHVIFFQIIEQSIDETHIITRCYRVKDKTFRCEYHSVGAVFIDPSTASLSFLYEVDTIQKTEQLNGMVISKVLFEKRCFLKHPCMTDGYSYYLGAKNKQYVVQTKYSDNVFVSARRRCKKSDGTFLDASKQTDELIQKALDFYNADKDRIKEPDDVLQAEPSVPS